MGCGCSFNGKYSNASGTPGVVGSMTAPGNIPPPSNMVVTGGGGSGAGHRSASPPWIGYPISRTGRPTGGGPGPTFPPVPSRSAGPSGPRFPPPGSVKRPPGRLGLDFRSFSAPGDGTHIGFRPSAPYTPSTEGWPKGGGPGSVQVPANRPAPPNMVVTGRSASPGGVQWVGYWRNEPIGNDYASASGPWRPELLTTYRTGANRPPIDPRTLRTAWPVSIPWGRNAPPGVTGHQVWRRAAGPFTQGGVGGGGWGRGRNAPPDVVEVWRRAAGPFTQGGVGGGGWGRAESQGQVITEGTPGVNNSMKAYGTRETAPPNMIVTGSGRSSKGPIIWGRPTEWRSMGGGGKDQYENLPAPKGSRGYKRFDG